MFYNLTKNQARRVRSIREVYFFDSFKRLVINDEDLDYLTTLTEQLSRICLLRDKYADEFYDAALDICIAAKHTDISKFHIVVDKHLSNVNAFDFLLLCRKILTTCDFNGRTVKFLTTLTNMYISLFVGGNVCGINTKTGELFVEDKEPLNCDIFIGYLEYEIRKTLNGYLIKGIEDKDIDLLRYLMVQAYSPAIFRVLEDKFNILNIHKQMSKKKLLMYAANRLSNTYDSNQVLRLFNVSYRPYGILDDSIFDMDVDNYYIREDGKLRNFVDEVLYLAFKENNLFERRDRILKEGGVHICLNGEFEGISDMHITEQHDFKRDEHYLVAEFNYSDLAYRELVLDLKHPDNLSQYLNYDHDFTNTLFMLYWLGLKDEVVEAIRKTSDADFTDEHIQSVLDLICDLFEQMGKELAASELKYADPISWNYTGPKTFNKQTVKSSKQSTDNDYEYVIKSIGAYVRKLPEGATASDEKKELARKYLLELKDGYTLVDGFERNQRVKKHN